MLWMHAGRPCKRKKDDIMRIHAAKAPDYDRLTDIWEAAVRATHDFLTEDDIAHYRPLVRDTYLRMVELVVVEDADGVFGFMGLMPPDASQGLPASVPMLFVHPSRHGRGAGRALLGYASMKYGALALDVNEQNPGACAFYERCGFTVIGRSDTDGEGRPFPLLHLFRNALSGSAG